MYLLDFVQSLRESLSADKEIPFAWIIVNSFEVLKRFPAGVTRAVFLTELQEILDKTQTLYQEGSLRGSKRLNNILEGSYFDLDDCIEVHVSNVSKISNTQTYVVDLVDCISSNARVSMYLHQRFYRLIHQGTRVFDPQIFVANSKGIDKNEIREKVLIRMTNCRVTETSGKKKLLPTAHMIIMLTNWTTGVCEQLYEKKIDMGQLGSLDKGTRDHETVIIAKVTGIGDPEQHEGRSEVTVLLNDGTLDKDAMLILFNDDINMSNLFVKGDLLFLSSPVVYACDYQRQKNTVLGYGPGTVVYCCPAKYHENEEFLSLRSGLTQLSQISRKAIGKSIDCSGNIDMIQVSDLENHFVNVTLVGCILSMHPVEKTFSPVQTSSLCFELYDETGICTIQVTDELIDQVSMFKEGQLIIASGMNVVCKSDVKGVRLSCPAENKCKFVNISHHSGHLGSPFIRTLTSLKQAELTAVFGVKATITGVDIKTPYRWTPVHTVCERKLSEILASQSTGTENGNGFSSDYWCHFCAQSCRSNTWISYILKDFHLIIDDGTKAVKVCVEPKVFSDISGRAFEALKDMSVSECSRHLASLVGEQWFFSLSNVSNPTYSKEVLFSPDNMFLSY